MKGRRVLPIATAIAAITLGATITVFYNHYTPPRLRSPFPITHTNHDTLRVVYIGDSWAAMHNGYDSQLQQTLEDSLQQPVKVVSAGFPGKTSKQIYECLFDDKMLHSLISQGCHFCFISAGINDTYQKMSTKYYKQSMDGIIQLLLANDIHPIILEIPDYDIIKAYRHQKTSRQWLRRFSMLVTCTQIDCKQAFRDTLRELIHEKNLQDSITLISYQSWNNDYINDLRLLYIGDGMHLNQRGYEKLDSCIAQDIIFTVQQ
jgi:lysophospholipase L1-like esterase